MTQEFFLSELLGQQTTIRAPLYVDNVALLPLFINPNHNDVSMIMFAQLVCQGHGISS